MTDTNKEPGQLLGSIPVGRFTNNSHEFDDNDSIDDNGMILIVIWSVCLLLAVHLYLKSVYSRFSKYGVKGDRPLPVLGNNASIIFGQKHLLDTVHELCQKYPNERFVGRFSFLDSRLLVQDIELIKKITTKDFEYFTDHKTIIDENTDPFFGRNLFSLKGGEWKDMRSTLSPAFTSSKIRAMVPFMNEVSNDMIRTLKKTIQESKYDYIDVNVKDLTTRFANDVIASCAFGLKVDSYTEQENKFYEMGKEITSFGYWRLIKFIMFLAFPNVTKNDIYELQEGCTRISPSPRSRACVMVLRTQASASIDCLGDLLRLKGSIFTIRSKNFFKDLVLDTMKDRELKEIIRPDMIHLFMEARKGKLTHDEIIGKDGDIGFAVVEESSVGKNKNKRVWSDIDMVAQALIFFFAGFETVSSTMAFLFHELAINPDVQDKLVQEIRETDARTGGKLDYDAIQKMKYLDMVISELLRLWSPVGILDRVCVKDYNLGKPNEKAIQDYIIRKGESLAVANWHIHRNPKYFPDPLKFDPERFSEENKHKIKPFTYMPFGVGPRNCIGSRFALCEVKIITYQFLKQLQLSPAPKTMIPAKLGIGVFSIGIKDGHWAKITLRK